MLEGTVHPLLAIRSGGGCGKLRKGSVLGLLLHEVDAVRERG